MPKASQRTGQGAGGEPRSSEEPPAYSGDWASILRRQALAGDGGAGSGRGDGYDLPGLSHVRKDPQTRESEASYATEGLGKLRSRGYT